MKIDWMSWIWVLPTRRVTARHTASQAGILSVVARQRRVIVVITILDKPGGSQTIGMSRIVVDGGGVLR